MVKELKIEGMEEFSAALVKMKAGTAPAVGSGDDGKVLTASYDAETGGSASWEDPPESVPEITSGDGGKVLTAHYTEGVGSSMSWDSPDTPSALVYDNTVTSEIGEYRDHSGDIVDVYPIKSGVFAPVSDVYLGNGSAGFAANIGDHAEILSCMLIATDSGIMYSIPCMTSHTPESLPVNNTYTATWNSSGLPSNGGSAKFVVTYIQKDNS